LSDNPNVRRVGLDVLFYDEITPHTAVEFAVHLDAAADESIARALRENRERPPVNVRINSHGGGCYSSLAMIDAIRGYQARGLQINGCVEGYAASAATAVLQACDTRRMGRTAVMLIHQVRVWGLGGKTTDIADEAKTMQALERIYKGLYLRRWKAGPKKLDAILGREHLLLADECLKLGLVDEVV